MSQLKISVLDQSPIHDGKAESSGLYDTLALAKICDQLGYHRYWCAEHHDTPGYASSAPEIMLAHVACATKRIRVGSGGVMLTHYSPFKVAETFRMLEALHPGRIDLGVGRAPGGNPLSHAALAAPRQMISHERYAQQSADLINWLNGSLPADHPYAAVKAQPADAGTPEFWMLGSSGGSSQLAGQLGAGFALALFIGTNERSSAIIDAYRRAFRPSASSRQPQAMIALAAITGENKEHAEFIAASHVYWKVQAFRHGRRDPLHPPQEALDLKKKLSLSDQDYFDETLRSYVLGTPAQCRQEIETLADAFTVDEVMVVNVTYSFEDRKRSYEELARLCSKS
jgi:luciferase family oxidoreductase group 1